MIRLRIAKRLQCIAAANPVIVAYGTSRRFWPQSWQIVVACVEMVEF